MKTIYSITDTGGNEGEGLENMLKMERTFHAVHTEYLFY